MIANEWITVFIYFQRKPKMYKGAVQNGNRRNKTGCNSDCGGT